LNNDVEVITHTRVAKGCNIRSEEMRKRTKGGEKKTKKKKKKRKDKKREKGKGKKKLEKIE
jgi:hypothetical protein